MNEERFIGTTGAVSGAASVLGSWQVCHSICIGIIALLSAVGITLVGMPLAFLTTVALPLWWVAVGLLVGLAAFTLYRRCVPTHLLLINAGLIIAGTPFSAAQAMQPWLWIVGGLIAIAGIVVWVRR